ncbi:hypothetical protein GQ457_15G008550 [Hibiscus cannabinus]
METKVLFGGLGGSIPVENVQALASNNLKNIPSRYIRPEAEFGVVSVDESLQIPVIDMSKLDHHDEPEKLHLACRDWGFFQLINHGVAAEVMEKMKIDTQEFFNLPLEEKMVCAQLPNHIEGYGQVAVVSQDQKLDWGDMLFLLPLPAVPSRNMRFWPTNPPSFRETVDKYSMELHKTMIHLIKLIAKNLGTDPGMLSSLFEDGTQGIKLNYYPPCAEASKLKDYRSNEKWVPVKHIPGALIVNVGDMIEILSNGEYKSIEHRAVVDPEKARLSIAALHYPIRGTPIGPLPDLVKANKVQYGTIPPEELLRLKLSSKHDGKRVLDQIKL